MFKADKAFFLFYFLLILHSLDGQISYAPQNISGLKIWLRSDTALTINSGKISHWKDISGNNYVFSQTTFSMMPHLQTNQQFENKASVYFDGGTKLESTVKFSFSNLSVFMVASQSAGEAVYGRFIDHDFAYGFWFGRNNFNDDMGGGYTESTAPYGNFQVVQNDVPFVFCNIRNGATNYSYLNSNAFPLSSRTTTSLTTATNPISIGASISNAFFGKKNIYEIVIYDRELSNTEQQQIEDYLYHKYTSPVALGTDILTCSFPVTLRAKKNYFKSYAWQDNSIKDSLVVNSSGKYYVDVVDVFGKTSTDTIVVTFDNVTRAVNLGNDTSFCAGDSVLLHAGPKHLTYNWANGATTNTLVAKTTGVYSVSVTDCLGNITTGDIAITVNPLPVFYLGTDRIFCFNSDTLLTVTNPSITNYLWQDFTTNDTMKINKSGVYSLTVTSIDGCKYKDDVQISVDSTLFNMSLGPDISLCTGNSITLTSGASPSLTYTWSTGQNASAITVTNTGQYSVIVTNTNNCVAKDTIDVTITGFAPEPQFSNNVACKNQTVHFTDLSLAPSGNTITAYLWNFGDPLSATNTSSLSNPSHTYADTGFYQINLQIQTDVGCGKAITKTIHVASTPTVNYTSSISCQNDSTSFVGSAITVPYSVSSYKWDFGDPISGNANFSAKQNPKHLFSDVAFFPVKFLVTNSAGCKDSITKNINVRSQVKADFTYQPPCSKTNVVFQDNSIVPNPSASHPRTWVLALQTNTFTFSGLSFSNTFTTTGVYPLSLTVNGTNGCSSTISKLIQIYQKPSADFEIPYICLNDTIQILNNSLPGSGVFNQFSWALNSNTISSTPSPTLNFNVAGTYSLSLTVSNTAQCKDSVTKTFTVNPLPNVTFISIPPTYIYKDSTVTFVPSVINGNSYNWTIGGQNYTVPSPTILINSAGTYSVNLFLIDENGCKNSGSGTFKAYDSYLDLEVNSIIANITSNNYLNVQVDLTNKGTIPIVNFEIKKTVSDASQVKETFNGTINPGVSYRYQFISEDNISDDLKNRLICVELESINKRMDLITKNNQLCDALNINEIQVFEPQPNPANQIDVLLPVIVPYSQEVKVDIINSIGELESPQYSVQLNEGLNYIKIPSSGLNHGVYMIKVLIEDKEFMKKLLKY